MFIGFTCSLTLVISLEYQNHCKVFNCKIQLMIHELILSPRQLFNQRANEG